jgi:CheY-like chemotaxis protein
MARSICANHLGPTDSASGAERHKPESNKQGLNQYQSMMDNPRAAEQCWAMDFRQEKASSERLLVSVVDDDESIRESLPDLLREFGFAARAFSSAEDFLLSDCVDKTKCLILDIVMPGMTGLDLQQELRHRRQKIPVIFITARKDEAFRERAFNQGAVKFLNKPFSDTALLDALHAAIHSN